jgi:hypothetical protein
MKYYLKTKHNLCVVTYMFMPFSVLQRYESGPYDMFYALNKFSKLKSMYILLTRSCFILF